MAENTLTDIELLEIISKSPIVSIDIIIHGKNDDILLGLRKNRPARNCWFVPGGRLRKDESVAVAFERIIHSELMISKSLSDAKFLGVFIHNYPDNYQSISGIGTRYVALAYKLFDSDLEKPQPDSQHYRYEWFSRDQAKSSQDVHPFTMIYFDCDPLNFEVVELYESP
jgi:colanic acid biosynthesis protein WcaH